MITNKKFQPRQFLLQVHKHTAYNDLVAGEERLRRDVDQRAEALKNLVHQNFDRFVSAKNTIDHVYEEMKSKQLNQQQDYGTIDIQRSLDGMFMSTRFKAHLNLSDPPPPPQLPILVLNRFTVLWWRDVNE